MAIPVARRACAAAVVGGLPDSPGMWRSRTLAVVVSIAINVAIFISFGLAAGVQTYFPFPLMAALSAIPAVGNQPLQWTGPAEPSLVR